MIAEASESLVEVGLIEGYALLVEVISPRVVEGVQITHGGGGDAGVVNVYVGDDEAVRGRFIKDAGVVY